MSMVEQYEQIYNNLKAGARYGEYYALKYPAFHVALYINSSGKWICWHNGGSSANKNTLKDLIWIISVIFNRTPEQFVHDFSIYSDEDFSEWEKISNAQNTTEYRKWDRQ